MTGPAGYDTIASLYDADMALNMPFDDVGFYRALCLEARGTVLEMGCGNGRILLALLAAGVEATGVDRSQPMLDELRRKAHAAGIAARACRMDARALAFRPAFDVVLCPYSLITYMNTAVDAARLVGEARRVLRPRGLFVVDAFVPRAGVDAAGFSLDYRRALGTLTLERSKRITRLTPEVNRIERRYRILEGDALVREIETREDIRPLAPQGLRALVAAAGFTLERAVWDYRDGAPGEGARFFTAVARAPGQGSQEAA
jgi:SAM-dependent methyltransferase